MTIFEIAANLPNGFHDAEVLDIRLDYSMRTARFTLDIWMGIELTIPEVYRRAELKLTGLGYCSMDLPDERYPFATSSVLTIDLHEATAFHSVDAAFSCRLWVNEWNGFIHLSANAAELTWLQEPLDRGQG